VTINEDTGEDVTCPLCRAEEWWGCGHLVAAFDRSFGECSGGELYGRENEIQEILERAFLPHLKASTSPRLVDDDVMQLWETAKLQLSEEEEYLDFDGYVVQRLLIEALRNAGAVEPEGTLIDPGGPGMTSLVALLFAENPGICLNDAKAWVRLRLGVS
jgi:hypothetical protein